MYQFDKQDTKMIKGIAIILMFYHHLFAFPDRLQEGITYVSVMNIAANDISYYIGVFGRICVYLFLFLGGYGIYMISSKIKAEEYAAFTFNRLKKIYLSYWKVFAVAIPVSLLLECEKVQLGSGRFVKNLLAIEITYNLEWWFLTPYVILVLVFPILKRVIRKSQNVFLEVLSIVFLNELVLNVVPQIMATTIMSDFANTIVWFDFMRALKCMPTFLVGCIFAKYDILSKVKNRHGNNGIWLFISVAVVGMVFYIRQALGGDDYNDYLYAPILVCCFSVILQNRFLCTIRKVLERIGERSTTMWLTHSFYCYMWCQKVVFAPKYSVLIVIWLLVITYFTAVLLDKGYGYLRMVWEKCYR